MNRKERVLSYLQQNTVRFVTGGFSALEGFETEEIARALQLDRANVSKLLNELWNAGLVMKVQGRPTLYLSMRTLESALPGRFVPITLASAGDLLELCREAAAGTAAAVPAASELPVTDSLLPLVQEAVSVCGYPPYGLPMLLVSPSTKDVETVVGHAFAQIKEKRGPDAKLVMVDCRGNLAGDRELLHQLFGCSKNASPTGKAIRSCFEASGHGVICLVGVHRLSDYILELLLTDRKSVV